MIERDEEFEQLLSLSPRIDDGGFTEALLARLPRRRRFLQLRSAILAGFALSGCAIVASIPGARLLLESPVPLPGFGPIGEPSVLSVAVVALLAVWSAVAAATSDA